MAIPEGSPTHPSYPAGHAAIAGACVTVLKAFFDENALFPEPVEPNSTGLALHAYKGSLTIGAELNKLASNITLGRDWAGVHYRSDGTEGMLLGEEVAISLLKDWRDAHPSSPKLTVKKFSGDIITI
jgi:membrane-associated phospholipid phosphatase